MPPIADSILILLLLTNFFILGTSTLRSAIRGVALQGVLLSLLPLFVDPYCLGALALMTFQRLRGRSTPPSG